MSDRYIEKSFLYLLGFSLLIHLVVGALVLYLPAPKPPLPKEPVFIDLQQIPESKVETPLQQQTPRLSDRRVRTEREMVPRGSDVRNTMPSLPPRPAAPSSPPQQQARPREAVPTPGEMAAPGRPSLPPSSNQQDKVPAGSSVAGLLKPRQQTAQAIQSKRPNLLPKTDKLAKLEEEYRRKFESDIVEGESIVLNANDTKLISFFRRFENLIYGVWQTPPYNVPTEVIYLVTFKSSNGQIIDIQKVETSGNHELDDAAYNAMRAIGPVGALPKDYKKPEYKIFLVFLYGSSYRKVLR